MLKKTKWKNQDPKKVIKKKEFKDWLLKRVKEAIEKDEFGIFYALYRWVDNLGL